jgi:hypothetical protein
MKSHDLIRSLNCHLEEALEILRHVLGGPCYARFGATVRSNRGSEEEKWCRWQILVTKLSISLYDLWLVFSGLQTRHLRLASSATSLGIGDAGQAHPHIMELSSRVLSCVFSSYCLSVETLVINHLVGLREGCPADGRSSISCWFY